MLQLLSELRHKVAIGFVGGSNLVKQQEQLATPDINVTSLFDFCFAENGLTAYRLGEELASQSFISWIGQDNYNKLVKWYVVMQRFDRLELPIPTTITVCKVKDEHRLMIFAPGSSTTSPISIFQSSAAHSSSSATA
jgi:hypothetical protein